MPRFLFGPCDAPEFLDRFLRPSVDSGTWSVFGARTGSWEEALAGAAPPDALLVWPGYTSVPPWVWAAPVPVVALAHDPNLLWHGYRHLLPRADLVLTDAPAAARLRRAGLGHVRAANLYGLDRYFAAALGAPETARDLDLVFVGNVSPAVQAGRLPWLGRLAALGARFRVHVAAGVFGAEYRALLRRAKLVFNRSVRGECNLRALEAAASGAVLLQEAGNEEVPDYLAPGTEFAPYTDADFEEVVAGLLAADARRAALAAAARERVRRYTFGALVEGALAVGGPDWDEVIARARRRADQPVPVPLAARVWPRVSLAGPGADPELVTDLSAAGADHELGVLAGTAATADPHLARAARGNRVSALGYALARAELGDAPGALAVARALIADLDANAELTEPESDTVPYPARFDWVRVGWDRAGFDHPDEPGRERAEKGRLVRGRALALIAELTGDAADHAAAAACCPERAHLHAALGGALVRAGRPDEALAALRAAVAGNPLDHASAAALVGALESLSRADEAARVRAERQVLARVAPGLAPAELAPAAGPGPARAPATRFVDLTAEQFAARFGDPDTSAALSGFTLPHDAHAVLALVAHLGARRILEIGTAAGHMTANLTAFTPPDAVVYSIGLVAEGGPRSGSPHQEYEVPRRDQFARFVNHFGTGYKARLIAADSRAFDFARLGPLDLAFVDGGHDLGTARSDSLGAYRALRPGGCLVWHDLPSRTPWVEVERAVAGLGFPEPVYRVAGTQVGFLIKGEGLGAAAGADSARVAVTWDGEFGAVHSLAHVNRSVCAELAARGHAVGLVRARGRTREAGPAVLSPDLAGLFGADVPGAVQVRHQWPPDFTAPPGPGPFVLVQPWEFGRVPRAWVGPITDTVDEVWVPSRAVLRAFVASGVPEDRVAVVPNGVDPDRFRPGLEPLPLPTEKRVKLLFVGGTIPRKGFDVLLGAYRRAFTRADDVCLVVKDMGAATFYRDQSAAGAVRAAQSDPTGPEIVYLDADLGEAEVPRLFAACDALVHPYRGEGFALPVLEAMACGLPVAVTSGGPTDEFVPPGAGWRVPARLRYLDREAVGDLPTAGRPWWLEPDPDALVEVLREVVADRDARVRCGRAAQRAALGWTWARAAAAVEDRVRVLRARTPVRFQSPVPVPSQSPPGAAPAPPAPAPAVANASPVAPPRVAVPAVTGRKPRVSLTMIVKNEEHHLGACLESVRDLVDEAVVIDTGSTDRTVEIARSFGCVVGEFPWVDHFAAARNAALDRATGDYAFWMDADDRLDAANRDKLRTVLAGLSGANEAFVMKCLCVGDRPGAGATAVDHVRLFRAHPAHRWTYRVHEQILPALRASGAEVKWSDVSVRHVGYVDPAVRRRKLDRDLRLLKLDAAEKPGDPFTLFNLGSIYHETGDHAAAADALEKSLAGSHVKDSIVRKTYALLARCQHQGGDPKRAAATCRVARQHYPDDAELVFLAAGLARETGDPRAAEGLYRKLIDGTEAPHFASVDTALRAVKGRHNLAVLMMEQDRWPEAEGLWRAALVHDPHFLPAQVGLGEVCVKADNEAGLARQLAALEEAGEAGAIEGAILSARWKGARGDHSGAIAVLEEAVSRFPGSLGARMALSHARIAADAAPEALEAAFRGILELDPGNTQAKRNLEVLYRKTGRWVEGILDGAPNA
ncbi:family 2 glycosyl transferase : Glycosyl transferase OS=Singulisphaera acidiphila (strain ATCC BAA-1392 / DSM 18658 / VKM B-2454 / MOB10) GN=Sinac_0358 PE=4 SV=1: Glyco_trans_1_2: Methyltransf_24: Glyco_transf_4: Glycos_transf_1: Glycos_transf_2: TPR_7: TPR_6: TPR_10 [Gemmata massiliana]|uniref:Glycosyltransferase 2-like domain-containing protein n=1 Tax=Gemmata massiliana TaxID=1210884 RepID=A0A6P2CSR5_9BACT|nr:glycosyltransferase [Gemmata massiliana]VTR91657.1 family 2 glycosyl transferase : Glycosyl transferase OS=Singulisphaera acidiphila (strain ATCC BAA-1392 / DSM 18658 / VKM B-2454 / MOB10) GN=Sinac_0358 PE=4 SV=1: Glyco_trans_1_2: Methyltransf_24: Glyco_transf_4: Glycos_transf_1: Glycos_transf_2: TPR_7: TPR_6: TPR_10 [Gemmata massiliana]